MFSAEQRKKAIDLFIKYDHSYASVIRELGYPHRQTLRNWWEEYKKTGDLPLKGKQRKSKYTEEQKRTAVNHYLEHGKCASRTARVLGFPSPGTLNKWIDEYAPGCRIMRYKTESCNDVDLVDKVDAVLLLETKMLKAENIADELGITQETLYHWREKLLDRKVDKDMKNISKNMSSEELKAQIAQLQKEVHTLQLKNDILEGTIEIIKKDQGTDPKRLSNKEKTLLINSLRDKYKLVELLKELDMAKSSYEYVVQILKRKISSAYIEAREKIVDIFNENKGIYGYRRILSIVNNEEDIEIGEWSVRNIMKKEGLKGKSIKKKRNYSSYKGETSKAPDNLLLNKDKTHDFHRESPNEAWVTDLTEFAIPAGKVYLNPIIDCFDGLPLSWSISTSPNAEIANSSLESACRWLGKNDHPIIHSDRGCHYRWPGWIEICEKYGLQRSMSRKGCSPDNARAEGFFGRLKVEFFHGHDWKGVSVEQFIEMLHTYLTWYREKRIKSDLDYKSPMQYRRDLGLVSA